MINGNETEALTIRVSDKEREEMRQMAEALGFLTKSGKPNLAEYVRNIHAMVQQLYNDGKVVRQPPITLAVGATAALGKKTARELHYEPIEE